MKSRIISRNALCGSVKSKSMSALRGPGLAPARFELRKSEYRAEGIAVRLLEPNVYRHADRNLLRRNVRDVRREHRALLELDVGEDVRHLRSERRMQRPMHHCVAVHDPPPARTVPRALLGEAFAAARPTRELAMPARAAQLHMELPLRRPIPEPAR